MTLISPSILKKYSIPFDRVGTGTGLWWSGAEKARGLRLQEAERPLEAGAEAGQLCLLNVT